MSPRIVFRKVDFPAPFGPKRPVAPCRTLRLRSANATCEPYRLVRLWVSMMRSFDTGSRPEVRIDRLQSVRRSIMPSRILTAIPFRRRSASIEVQHEMP